MKKQDIQKGEIIIYKASKNEVKLKVRFKEGSVWLRQDEIAKLFGKDRTVIARHINKIFQDKEIDKKSNVQKMHIADVPENYRKYWFDNFTDFAAKIGNT